MPRKHGRTWDDPLVPIHGNRLQAALEHAGYSRRAAAKKLNEWNVRVKAQTLDYLVAGQQEKCRQSVRTSLARLVGLDERWLSGERAGLDHIPYPPNASAEDLDQPSRAQIARHRFATACYTALMRDLRAKDPAPGAAERMFAEEEWRVHSALVMLMKPHYWIKRLHKWERALPMASATDDEHENAPVHLSQAFMYVLQPWLDGDAELDLDALAHVLGAPGTAQRPHRSRPRRKK